METIDMMGEVDTITQEQISEQDKADREAQLVPAGTYEGTVITWVKVDESEKGENNQFKGVPQYRVGIKFYDCPESGKVKSQFFSMTPHKVLNESGRPKAAYTSLVGLVKAMNMQGQPIPDVLEQAKVTRAKYRIGQFETTDGGTVNFLRGVGAACLILFVVGCAETSLTRHCVPDKAHEYQHCTTTLKEVVACEGSCKTPVVKGH